MKFKSGGGSDSEGSKHYLKLRDKESVNGVLRGEPFEYYQHWINNQTTPCTGKDVCDQCKAGNKGVFRFKLNMIVNENGALTAKVLNQGWKLYQQLKALHESGWDLEKNKIRLSRSGSGKNDTVYNVTVLPESKVTAAAEKQLSAVKLIDFRAPEVSDSQETEEQVSEPESDLPF